MDHLNNTKGIILAGGKGSRLYPLTLAVSKQLLPIYDKPLIYYPLTTLMLAEIKDILVITTEEQEKHFSDLLGDGSQWGLSISYATQDTPRGLADAFIVGKSFVGADKSCLILGDNIFHSQGFSNQLNKAKNNNGATVFGCWVDDPERYGVLEFNQQGDVAGIEEKPKLAKSNYAVTGLYFYDNDVLDMAASLKPSSRGELEITDLNNLYLEQGKLTVEKLAKGATWMDAGTHDSLLQASNYVETVQNRQGINIACPEEIAYSQGWIDYGQLIEAAETLGSSAYKNYLLNISKCA